VKCGKPPVSLSTQQIPAHAPELPSESNSKVSSDVIISHKHKFIFIKTEKTAGTSIEIALSKICGPDDIITPISKADETLRWKMGGLSPRNYKIPFHTYKMNDWLDFLIKRKRVAFYNHAGSEFIKEHLDSHTWNSYYKFCFERNPWDKVVSFYFWRNKTEPRPPISEFVQKDEANIVRGFSLYTIRSQVVVDRVYLYENLKESLDHIAEKLGLREQLQLPMAKSNIRPSKQSYRDLLSDVDRRKIAVVYAREIALFNYEW
jgi:hypothetical protein